MINTVYCLLTKRCNLSCKHCDVYKYEDNWNQKKFVDTLRNIDGKFILFGGECSLYPERIKLLLEDDIIKNRIKSVSTNLLILNDEILTFWRTIGNIGTSWNPNRFNDIQYQLWLNNLKVLSKYSNDINITLLIVLEDSLFTYDFDKFINMLKELDNMNIFKSVKFEPYVGSTSDRNYFIRSDNFLSKLYDHWNFNMILDNIERAQINFFNCSKTYHVDPDGTLHIGCAHEETITYSNDCLTCENNSICRPCQLQKFCTVPYNFTKKVYNDIESGKLKPVPGYEHHKLNLEVIKNVIN